MRLATPAPLPLALVLIAGVAAVGVATPVAAQQSATPGPVIHSGGAVYDVEVTYPTRLDIEYRVAFDVTTSPDDATQLNASLNSVARFINMHARAGVPRERIRTAIVVHGGAGWDIVDDETYRARHGAPNPNRALLEELLAFGTEIVLCGQTAAARQIPTDRLIDGVTVALSAMTAFVALQEEGYRVNPW